MAVAAAVLEITSLPRLRGTAGVHYQATHSAMTHGSIRVYFLKHISGVISFFKFQSLPDSYEGTGNFNEKHLMLENFSSKFLVVLMRS